MYNMMCLCNNYRQKKEWKESTFYKALKKHTTAYDNYFALKFIRFRIPNVKLCNLGTIKNQLMVKSAKKYAVSLR